MRSAHRLGILLAASLFAGSAAAAPPSDKVRDQARAIGAQALSLFDSGSYAEALAQFERADSVYLAPTHGLMAARCLEKLGRLVEASGKYLAVTQLELDAKASEAFRQAKVDAAKELQALLPRIPTIAVDLTGGPTDGVAVLVDGKPLQNLGTLGSVDPGQHRVEAKRGDLVLTTADVRVAEGESRRVPLSLGSQRGPLVDPGGASPPAPTPDAPVPTQRLLGWAGVGLGGVGLLVGGITGGMAVSAKGDLDGRGCVDGVCPRGVEGDVDSYNTLRNVSTLGVLAGGVLLAGGVVLLVIAPKDAAGGAAVRAAPWIGAGSAGVVGSF